jgi:putative FmdB family regulatory protein
VPLYEYECEKCGKRVEKIEKYDGPHVKKCPSCGGHLDRLQSAPAIQFKGSGWYVTDYGRSSSKESAKDSENKDSGNKDSAGKEGKESGNREAAASGKPGENSERNSQRNSEGKSERKSDRSSDSASSGAKSDAKSDSSRADKKKSSAKEK